MNTRIETTIAVFFNTTACRTTIIKIAEYGKPLQVQCTSCVHNAVNEVEYITGVLENIKVNIKYSAAKSLIDESTQEFLNKLVDCILLGAEKITINVQLSYADLDITIEAIEQHIFKYLAV